MIWLLNLILMWQHLNFLKMSKEEQTTNMDQNQFKKLLKCWSRGEFGRHSVKTSVIEARMNRLRKMKFQPSLDLQSCVQQLKTLDLIGRYVEIESGYPLVKGSTIISKRLKLKSWSVTIRQAFGCTFGYWRWSLAKLWILIVEFRSS